MRQLVVVLVVAVTATVATRVTDRSNATRADTSTAVACGSFRWTVKTLQDRPRLLRVKATTIANLVAQPHPAVVEDTPRLPYERQVFSVVAAVTDIQPQADQDLHLVLRARRKHMIVESPAPGCVAGATAYRRRQMRGARRKVRLCARARIAGVAFFDYPHQQFGAAPNAIELHPILDFACLSS